ADRMDEPPQRGASEEQESWTRMKPVPDGALSKFMTGIEGRPAPQVLQSGASCSRFDASSSSLSH
ncbi:hypothetical protein AK812_SmicGene47145, partial [Symbiodinium microadriaticum]